MTESVRPKVFLTCLGITNYSELEYAPLTGEAASPVKTRFIQYARLRALEERGLLLHAAFVLVTEDAHKKNWTDDGHGDGRPGLKNTVDLELKVTVSPIPVPNGSSEDEFWEIFDSVADKIPENAEIFVDLTHGFRTMPTLVLLALEYLEKAKGARLIELTYGADKANQQGQAPVWNLSPFLIIRDWAEALSMFLQFGDTRPLASVAKSPTKTIKKLLRDRTPESLHKLPDALEKFGEAILKCHSPSLGPSALNLKTVSLEAAAEVNKHFQLKPLGLILQKISHKLIEFPDSLDSPKAQVIAQMAAARWCIQHGLAMQGFTFIREAYVTAMALLAGRPSSKDRKEADKLLGCVFTHRQGKTVKTEGWVAAIFERWLETPPTDVEVWEHFGSSLDKLLTRRNQFDHAHTADGGGLAPPSEEKLTAEATVQLRALEKLIDNLSHA